MSKPKPVPQKRFTSKLHTENKVPLTKFDVARRELETAITLWFHDGDIVAVHQLTMAAHEILRVINKSRGGPPMMGDPAPCIRPEYSDFYREITFKSYNFFKHASKDADEVHWFAPATNQCFILDATERYHALTTDIRPLFRLFKWYLRLHEPRFFVDPLPTDEGRRDLLSLTKAAFFSELLPFAQSPESISEQIAGLREMFRDPS